MSCHGGVDQGGLVGNQWHSTNKTESNSLEKQIAAISGQKHLRWTSRGITLLGLRWKDIFVFNICDYKQQNRTGRFEGRVDNYGGKKV